MKRLRSVAAALPVLRRTRGYDTAMLLIAMAFASAAAHGAGVVYYGGPVVSNAKVFMVNWSSDVAAQVQTQMPVFYADILTSDYWEILDQYATPAPQRIGFGTFTGSATLTSTACSAGSGACTTDDIEVLSTITARINSDDPAFPPLAVDALGNVDTVFFVHFSPSVTIMVQSARSCIEYAAFYENIQTDAAHGNRIVPVAIIPDCFSGNETASASWILTDIAADPQVLFTPGWIDAIGASVGDLCSQTSATIVTNSHSYSVAKVWSNSSNACISANRIFADGFGP